MKRIVVTLDGIGLASLSAVVAGMLACGGSSSPTAPATAPTEPTTANTLVYSAPTVAGYQLVQDSSSTATHLILDLVGPAGTQLKGVLLTLSTDATRAAWGNPGGALDPYLNPGQALALGTGAKLLKGTVSGATLQAALYQKGSVTAATLGTQPILSVALDLKPGALTGGIALTPGLTQILDATGKTQIINVAAGSLSAK